MNDKADRNAMNHFTPWARDRIRRLPAGRALGGAVRKHAPLGVVKFSWHLPLNRQTKIFRGYGIELDRSTLVHWVMRAAW